jgi:hypothetical protein
MNGKSRFPIDAALILRDAGLAAVTVDTDLAVQKLAQVGAVWQNPPDVRDGTIYLVGHVESLSDTASLDFYTCEDAAKSNPKLQKSVPLAAGEWFAEPIDQFSWLANHALGSFWFATINVAGTTHSAAVFAYLAPDYDC